jgi:peptidoglycan hydrolase-like protein with peptidoglycan-binding domain
MKKKQKLLAILFIIAVSSVGILKAEVVTSQTTQQTVPPPQITPVLPYKCPPFVHTLYRGITDVSTNGEVTRLQKMLAEDATVYPEALVTGYYGSLTEKAVQRLQAKQGIVSFGDALETGYGLVGPQTRAKIIIIFCPPDDNTNLPPTINGVSGPSVLKVGEVGEWRIETFDPEQGPLTYSVVWGDETHAAGILDQEAHTLSPVKQKAVFTHVYSREGTYSPTFIVTDNTGLSAKTGISVSVGRGVIKNISPVINVAPAVLSDIEIGQSVSFSWNAADVDNDNLSWSILWGDGTSAQGLCQSRNPQNRKDWAFNSSHTWQKVGTYTVKATVNDCRGGSGSHTFNVTVSE